MKLRSQLTLLALAGLLIPALALYSIYLFSQQAKSSHLQSLAQIGHAISAHIASQPSLLKALGADKPMIASEYQLYSHRVTVDMQADGEITDWQHLALTPLVLPGDSGPKASFLAASNGHHSYILLEIQDTSRRYHQSQTKQLASGDHIVLYAGREQGAAYYVIRAELPGRIQAMYRNSQGQAVSEDKIQGVWRETHDGYRVELTLPTTMVDSHFGVAVIDKGTRISSSGTLSNLAEKVGTVDSGVLPATVAELVSTQDNLNRTLASFHNSSTRLTLLDQNHWVRGQSGQLNSTQEPPTAHSSWFNRLLLNKKTAKWQDRLDGRGPKDNGPSILRRNNTLIARVSVPVQPPASSALESQTVGHLLLEKTLEPKQLLDPQIAAKLVFAAVAGGGTVFFILFGYASYMRWRIRRLSSAVARAQCDNQSLDQVLQDWPKFALADEISDLSGEYRELLSQQLNQQRYLRTLTAKLSHELRTPLAVITGALDNLAHASADSASKYAERAREGCSRLSQLIRSMTEASRVEASIATADLEQVNLAQLIRDITQGYQGAYPEQLFCCEISPENANWNTLLAPELVVQMLDKLVENAISFCSPGTPIELHLRQEPSEELGLLIHLCVRNQGPHLPEALDGHLFQSLTSHRSDNSSGQLHLGLGLYIVNLIAEFHRGEVQARNCPNGVEFEAIFPVHLPTLGENSIKGVDNSG